jgi:hypothetical protein
VLLVADHVFDPAILKRWLEQRLEDGEIMLPGRGCAGPGRPHARRCL